MSDVNPDRLHDLLDGRLSTADEAALRAEVAASPELASELAELERLRELFEAVPEPVAPVELKAAVMASLPAAAAVATPSAPAPRGRLILGWVVAVAAALLLGVVFVLPGALDQPGVATARFEAGEADSAAEKGVWEREVPAASAPAAEYEQADRQQEGAPADDAVPAARDLAGPVGAVAGESRRPRAAVSKKSARGAKDKESKAADGSKDESAGGVLAEGESAAAPRKPRVVPPPPRETPVAKNDQPAAEESVPAELAEEQAGGAVALLDELTDASRLSKLAAGLETAVVVIRVDDARAAQTLMAQLERAQANPSGAVAKQPAAPGAPAKRSGRRDAHDPADSGADAGESAEPGRSFSGPSSGLAARSNVQSRDVRLSSAVRALLLTQRDIRLVDAPRVGRVVAELSRGGPRDHRAGEEADKASDEETESDASTPERERKPDPAGQAGDKDGGEKIRAEKGAGKKGDVKGQPAGGADGGGGARPPAPTSDRKRKDSGPREGIDDDADEADNLEAAPRSVRVVIVVAPPSVPEASKDER